MKTLRVGVLLLVAIGLGLGACKKDKGDDDAKADIVGRWSLKTETYKEYMNGQLQGQPDVYVFEADDYMEFKSDGQGIYYQDGDEQPTFSYSINNEGNKITIDFGNNDRDTWDIKTLTSTDLVLYLEERALNGTLEGTIEYVLKR